MPPPSWVDETLQRLVGLGITQQLGSALFRPQNWHQSFSERIFEPSAADCDAMVRIGRSISAHACTLLFNRIEGPNLTVDQDHCMMRARGTPKSFSRLLGDVQQKLKGAGFGGIATGARPHMTLSYRARRSFDNVPLDPVIPWTIQELCLIIGGGDPYHYEIIERWSLKPDLDPPVTQPFLL